MLRRERTENLNVVCHDGASLTARPVKHCPIAAPDEIIALGDGIHVVAGLAQQHRDLRRQLLIQDGPHERSACGVSPAGAGSRAVTRSGPASFCGAAGW